MDEMRECRPDAHVTNADLEAALSLLATKVELQDVEKRLALEMVHVQSDIRDIKQAMSGLSTKAELQDMGKRLALEMVKTQSDIRDIKQTMSGLSTKADTDRIMTFIDSFANKALGYDNARNLHGHRLTEHAERLEDHEQRIQKLEGEA